MMKILEHEICERCTEVRAAFDKPPLLAVTEKFGMHVCSSCSSDHEPVVDRQGLIADRRVVDNRMPYWLVTDRRQGKGG